jgi:hypothetical protein
MSLVSRYSADDATSYNAALQSLEDLYLRIGNVFEVIASGTLEAETLVIDLPVSSDTWRVVRLMTNLEAVSGVGAFSRIYANNNKADVYGYTGLIVTTAISDGATLSTSGISQRVGISAFGDAWFYFTPFGFIMSSTITNESGGAFIYRYGGYGQVGSVQSLQIEMIDAYFATGGTYILEGIRA